jgi:nitroimidazol reductase NimA-like FMN-containing flavoprotein (pyridoxamine 5'-phosphate oxidase superfamily)
LTLSGNVTDAAGNDPPAHPAEIHELLRGDHIARLATIDAAGFPHVTPLRFLWEHEVFHLARDTGRPHLTRIQANPRVGLVIDIQNPERGDGERPNRQVRVVGNAELHHDTDGAWSRRSWAKYMSGQPDPATLSRRLEGRDRTLILIRPNRLIGAASI